MSKVSICKVERVNGKNYRTKRFFRSDPVRLLLWTRGGAFLKVPYSIALRLTAFEHIFEMRLLVEGCAIKHFVQGIVPQIGIVLPCSAVGEVVDLCLFF